MAAFLPMVVLPEYGCEFNVTHMILSLCINRLFVYGDTPTVFWAGAHEFSVTVFLKFLLGFLRGKIAPHME